MTTPTPEDFAAVKKLCLEYEERLTKVERENAALCAFINRECQMTANDTRIQEIISAALKPV